MKEIRRVMVCVDLSGYSRETIEYALAFTKGNMAEILLFNVINIKDVEAVKAVAKYYPGKLRTEYFAKAEKADHLERIGKMIKEHFPLDAEKMKILIGMGTPFQEILRAIDTEKIDLVVIANKGRTNLARTLFGSNAEKVLRHSPVPVLSIRDHKGFSRDK